VRAHAFQHTSRCTDRTWQPMVYAVVTMMVSPVLYDSTSIDSTSSDARTISFPSTSWFVPVAEATNSFPSFALTLVLVGLGLILLMGVPQLGGLARAAVVLKYEESARRSLNERREHQSGEKEV